MLTKSDLEQIKNYLALYGKKDSQLPPADIPLGKYDKVAVVQKGSNRLVPITELQETIGVELKKDVCTYTWYNSHPSEIDNNTLYICTTDDGNTVVQMFLQELPLLPSSGSTLTLEVDKSTIFSGKNTDIIVTGIASPAADTMKILKGSTEIISGSGTIVHATDTIKETTTYTVQASILGYNYTKDQTVTAVNPIYYGSGSSVSDFWEEGHKVKFNTPTTSPYKTYNVTVRIDGDKVYFAVPNPMEIHKATMNGFNFPLDNPDTSISGYRIYPSSNTYDATDSDTLNIVIS